MKSHISVLIGEPFDAMLLFFVGNDSKSYTS